MDARGKLAPSATGQVERRVGDFHQVMRVVARVDKEAHLGDHVRHVWMVTVPADIDHPLVRCEIFSLVASYPLRNVAYHKAPLHFVMDAPKNSFDTLIAVRKLLDTGKSTSPRISTPIRVFVERGKIPRYHSGF